MVNLLHQIQVQLADSMTALAILAMVTGAGIAIHSSLAAWGIADRWRKWAYGVGAGLGLYTAVSYGIVIFVDASASVAWLRPAIILWMIHYLVMVRIIATVAEYDPDEMAQEKIKKLGYQLKDREQDNENARGTNKILIEQIRETEAKNKALAAGLERARSELVDTATRLMDANEEVIKQEGVIHELKRQLK